MKATSFCKLGDLPILPRGMFYLASYWEEAESTHKIGSKMMNWTQLSAMYNIGDIAIDIIFHANTIYG